MKFKNMIFVLAISFSVIFMSMLGTSYAYYLSTGGTELKITTGNIDTGVAVIFNQSEYINMSTGVPINSVDVDTLAATSIFTLVPDKNILSGADVAINIGIMDITIANELKIADFKYKFTCNDGTTTTTLSTGDGTSFTDEILSTGYLNLGTLSTTDNNLDINKTYTCTLRVWLEETGANQNSLMNKNFSGLIKVNTLFKK